MKDFQLYFSVLYILYYFVFNSKRALLLRNTVIDLTFLLVFCHKLNSRYLTIILYLCRHKMDIRSKDEFIYFMQRACEDTSNDCYIELYNILLRYELLVTTIAVFARINLQVFSVFCRNKKSH